MKEPAAQRFADYLDWISSSWELFGVERHPPRPKPLAPGLVLKAELARQGLSQSELARQVGCTHARINEIINGKRSMTPRLALELERALGLPASYWLSLYVEYALSQERQLARRRK